MAPNKWHSAAALAVGTYYIKVANKHNSGTVPGYTLSASWTELLVPPGVLTAGTRAAPGVGVPAAPAGGMDPVNTASATVGTGGLSLQFMQNIVDADPHDGIASTADVQPLDDFDGDGQCNLLEYAFGTDPVRADAADAIPRLVMATVNGQVYPAVSFRRLKEAGTLYYGVEETTDMIHWTPVPMPWQVVGNITDASNGTERITVRASAPVSGHGQSFLRVRVSE